MLLKSSIYVGKILYNKTEKTYDIKKYSYLTSLYLTCTDQNYVPFIKISEDKFIPLELIGSIIDLYMAYFGLNDFILFSKPSEKHPFYIDESTLFQYYPIEEEKDRISLKVLKQLPF